ncbi:hypothetical protein CBL_21329, partial [Carabus blaptoides fortunei]
IRPLKSFALNPQLGIKGSVVNVPIEVNEVLQVLPRKFDNMATIQLKLKRHMLHSTDYMFETIRPAVVCEALRNEDTADKIKIIAPGQEKFPVPWHMIGDIDELCFPRIFGGYKLNIQNNISYNDRAKSECRRRDR